jgi:hypothetical protein
MTVVEFERWVKYHRGGHLPPHKTYQDWYKIKLYKREEILKIAKVRLPRLSRLRYEKLLAPRE